MEEILHQNPHHISSSSLIPSIPNLEEAIQLNRFENKTTTAFIFYIAGLLTLLFFIFLLAYRNLGRYPNYQVFSVLIILLITLRTTAYFFPLENRDRKSTRLNSSHVAISYAVFCLKKKKKNLNKIKLTVEII